MNEFCWVLPLRHWIKDVKRTSDDMFWAGLRKSSGPKCAREGNQTYTTPRVFLV